MIGLSGVLPLGRVVSLVDGSGQKVFGESLRRWTCGALFFFGGEGRVFLYIGDLALSWGLRRSWCRGGSLPAPGLENRYTLNLHIDETSRSVRVVCCLLFLLFTSLQLTFILYDGLGSVYIFALGSDIPVGRQGPKGPTYRYHRHAIST